MYKLHIKDGKVKAMYYAGKDLVMIEIDESKAQALIKGHDLEKSHINGYLRFGDWFFEGHEVAKERKKNGK